MFPEVERRKLVELGQRSLWQDEGTEALDYLKWERGLSEEAIRRFQIGYCPLRVDHELAGRIITPICDPYGKCIALSTRHLTRKKDFWHEQFDKSFYLYGTHLAKEEMIRTQKAVVVEGEFDTAFLHSYKIRMAVGCCGSAFTPFHAAILARYVAEVYLVFDADKERIVNGKKMEGSGQRATKRAKAANLFFKMRGDPDRMYRDPSGMMFIPVGLPVGSDPDDFIKDNGAREFVNLLKESKAKAQEFELFE